MVNLEELKIIHELRESGSSWEEVAELIPTYTDNDRKLYYGYKQGLEDGDLDTAIKNAKQLQAIRKARKVLGIERSINNEQIRDLALQETIVSQFADAIKTLNPNPIHNGKSLKPLPFTDYNTNKTHLFVLTDFHYDGDTELFEVFDIVADKIIDFVQKNKINKILLAELGDLIDGAGLRTSQLMAIKKGMVSQIVEVSQAYVNMLRRIQQYVKFEFIIITSSNHTQLRNLGTGQNELVDEDLMKVFDQFVRTAMPELTVHSGSDVVICENGFNFYFEHGHLIKGKKGYLEQKQSDRGILYDFAFFGHYHTMKEQDLHSVEYWGVVSHDRKVFYAPALSQRHSNYEKDRHLSSVSGFAYYEFDEDEGHITSKKFKVVI